ncbi:hypothetical protein FB451DRAFT_1410490 [Mycena latifolia]|nr:hypothetical protein FB451DRAFT_1410490 [Mycena latifolia]
MTAGPPPSPTPSPTNIEPLRRGPDRRCVVPLVNRTHVAVTATSEAVTPPSPLLSAWALRLAHCSVPLAATDTIATDSALIPCSRARMPIISLRRASPRPPARPHAAEAPRSYAAPYAAPSALSHRPSVHRKICKKIRWSELRAASQGARGSLRSSLGLRAIHTSAELVWPNRHSHRPRIRLRHGPGSLSLLTSPLLPSAHLQATAPTSASL